jgi:hypothetical protein
MKPFKKVLLASTVLVLGGLALAFAATDIPSAVAELKANQAKAVKAGLYLSTSDYLKTLQVPSTENGAPQMQATIALFEKRAKGIQFEDTIKKQLREDKIEAVYADIEPAWKLVDEAATKPYVIFERNRQPLAATLFPEFSKFKMLVKLASWRATIASKQNDPTTAKVAWTRAAQMSQMADDEPVLISMLVRIACEAIVEDSIRKALNQHGQDPNWRAAAWEVLTILDQPLDFRAALTVEHRFACEGFDLVGKPDSFFAMDDWNKSDEGRAVIAFTKLPKAREANESRIHDCYSEYVTNLGADKWDAQKMIAASVRMERYVESKTGISYRLAKVVMPVFTQAGKAVAKTYAQRNVLMQAIKLLENPASKDLPLKGRYAQDSDGKPLRLIWNNSQRIIYSIGPNYIDDGGVIVRPTTGATQDYDYGVAIPK